MPNRTIYIRNEDLSLWEACSKKAELVSLALRGQTPIPKNASVVRATDTPMRQEEVGKVIAVGEPIKTPADAKKAVAKDNFCEHGFAPGFCKKVNCKNAR